MKALNTLYKGVYFRSRTEARWAVFFDALGVKWEYEKEGYDLGDGIWYLPDFWFPEYGFYGEVKPDKTMTNEELEKAKRLCRMSKRSVFMFKGIPSFGFDEERVAIDAYFWGKPLFPSDENGYDPAPGTWNDEMYEIERVNRWDCNFPFGDKISKLVEKVPCHMVVFPESNHPCVKASEKARSARF